MLGHFKAINRGDTLIEVLFAITVFSLVAVGGLSVMNQGSAASQRALEISLVRDQMDGQVDTLRFLNSSYVSAFSPGATYDSGTAAGQWSLMSAYIKTHSISTFSSLGGASCPSAGSYPQGSFILDTQYAKFKDDSTGALQPATTYSQLTYTTSNNNTPVFGSADGIWIEASRHDTTGQSSIGYIDFDILACWDSPGQARPITLGTIVRLYEPR